MRPVYQIQIEFDETDKTYSMKVFQSNHEEDRFTIIQTLEREKFKILQLDELEKLIEDTFRKLK